VTDECAKNVVNAWVTYRVNTGQTSYDCGPVTNTTGNIYRCSFDTTGKQVGNYNVTMIPTKEFNNNFSVLEQDAFKIISTQTLKSARVNLESDGWALFRNFTINVTDNSGDNVTIYAWEAPFGTESWTQIDTAKYCNVTCSQTPINFTRAYACSDLSVNTIRKFKFNATDTEGNSYETSTSVSGDYLSDEQFTLEKEDTELELFLGNNTNATLNAPTRLVLRVFDKDNRTYNITPTAATIAFNVSKNGNNAVSFQAGTNTTNGSGHVEFSFLPDRTYNRTRQDWLGAVVSSDSCYKANTSAKFNVTTLTNAPQLTNPVVDLISGGWGDRRVFNVTMLDTNDTATVSLWRASALAGPWTLIEEKNYTAVPNSTVMNYSKLFTNDLIGTWFFKFNATNTVGNTNETVIAAGTNFTLTADNVYYVYEAGQGVNVNRSGSQSNLLSFRVFDRNGTALTNLFAIKFSVSTDNSTYYSDVNYVNRTNSSGSAVLNFNPSCSPKFAVGEQQWKIQVNDSELTYYQQNDSSSSIPRNLFVQGDIVLELTNPSGAINFTQEQTVTFLGSTVDDCGDALTTTTRFALNGTSNVACSPVSQVGANAYTCDYVTAITTTSGYYNTSMASNRSYHYDNQTGKVAFNNTGSPPGLLFLDPVFKLQTANVTPTPAGWGNPNFNFSIVASSGKPNSLREATLWMTKGSPTFATQCVAPTCVNVTTTYCDNCNEQQVYWFRNFTAEDIGLWFFQLKMNGTLTSGSDSLSVEKDSTNVLYGGSGNTSSIVQNSTYTLFRVFVNDTSKGNNNNITPAANVTFRVYYPGIYDFLVGSNLTNSTGYAQFNFTSDCSFTSGSQFWYASVADTDSAYKPSNSSNFTITLDQTGCTASLRVVSVTTPSEIFQYKPFVVNTSITSLVGTSSNANITLHTNLTWIIDNKSQAIGSVALNQIKTVNWAVNATTYNENNVTISANSSDSNNATSTSGQFTLYKSFEEKCPEIATNGSNVLSHVCSINTTIGQNLTNASVEAVIPAGGNLIADWVCDAGDYRIASLNVYWEPRSSLNTTNAKISVYNGLGFLDIMHNKTILGNVSMVEIPLVRSQMFANESGYCKLKIDNVGGTDLFIDYVSLKSYLSEGIKILDVNPKVYGVETTGLETSEGLFNASVRIKNSVNLTYTLNVFLNITNSTGNMVNSSIITGINLPANKTIDVNFTNINTSAWNKDTYAINAGITGNFVPNLTRGESLVFKDVNVTMMTTDYMCNQTIEDVNVTIIHPFTDSVVYNVSLQVPSGWSFNPGSILVTGNESRSYTAMFNITSGTSAGQNITINATVNYTYPGISKLVKSNYSIEENNAIPIMEVIRETPTEVGYDTSFKSRLIIRNKGCAAATSISLTDNLAAGWPPFSLTLSGSTAGTVDLPNRRITLSSSDLGTINPREYKVVEYNLLSHASKGQTGTLQYALLWGAKNITERTPYYIKTIDYENEKHLSFDLVNLNQTTARKRSSDPSELNHYNFTVTNVGDNTIPANAWNVTLAIPIQCNVSNYNATFSNLTRKLTWQLSSLAEQGSQTFTFAINCTTASKYFLTAQGTNNTLELQTFRNSTGIGCSGSSCSSSQSFTFDNPNKSYEKMSELGFSFKYNFSG
ncbi:MAG: hypothetical protein HY361_05415, partial [Candidatus Aenigmarchaeota archaeon]|nr:hypothetical protein [Candidatus Aenigmarchaeota archaeon]